MKKVMFSLVAAVIAIGSVAFVKANPKVDPPVCPEGTNLYYYLGSYTGTNPDINDLLTKTQWSLTPPAGAADCGQIQVVCAICAYPDNQLVGRPELNLGEQSTTIQAHTQAIVNKFNSYDLSNNAAIDESEDELFFEKNR